MAPHNFPGKLLGAYLRRRKYPDLLEPGALPEQVYGQPAQEGYFPTFLLLKARFNPRMITLFTQDSNPNFDVISEKFDHNAPKLGRILLSNLGEGRQMRDFSWSGPSYCGPDSFF
jgi:hypothetical protein